MIKGKQLAVHDDYEPGHEVIQKGSDITIVWLYRSEKTEKSIARRSRGIMVASVLLAAVAFGSIPATVAIELSEQIQVLYLIIP